MVLSKMFLQQKAEALRLVRYAERFHETGLSSLAVLRSDCAQIAGGPSYAETLALAVKMIREITKAIETFETMSAVLDEWPRPVSHEPEVRRAKDEGPVKKRK
jgi:hypothetical protein